MRIVAAWMTGLLVTIALLTAAIQASPAAAESAGGGGVEFRLEAAEKDASGLYRVTAYAQDARDLYAYDLVFTYDNLRWKLVRADSGIAGFTVPAIVKGSQIRFAHTMVGSKPGLDGEVELATLTFERIRGGDAGVAWDRAKLVDAELDSIAYTPDSRILLPADAVRRAAFPDLAGHWAEAAVREAEELGFVSGFEDGTFRPQQEVTRAEFTALLVRALGAGRGAQAAETAQIGEAAQTAQEVEAMQATWTVEMVQTAENGEAAQAAEKAETVQTNRTDETTQTGQPTETMQKNRVAQATQVTPIAQKAAGLPYLDVGSDAWYTPEVTAAYAAGLIRGVAEDRFAPDAPVSREQMAVLLTRAYAHLTGGTAGGGDPSADGQLLDRFSDAADISDWAVEGVRQTLVQGFMHGKGAGLFDPAAPTSRAEAVQAILNVLKHE